MRPWPEIEKRGAMIAERRDDGVMIILPVGMFLLQIIASNGGGWDHVSVSVKELDGHQVERCPTWAEMSIAHRLCFNEIEYAMQLHVPPHKHVNNHPFVLHLWRPHCAPLPVPPKEFV